MQIKVTTTEAGYTTLDSETFEPNEFGAIYTLSLIHRTRGYTPGDGQRVELPELWLIRTRDDGPIGRGHFHVSQFAHQADAEAEFNRRTRCPA